MNPYKKAKEAAARDVVDAGIVHGMAVDNYGEASPEAGQAARAWRKSLQTAYDNGATDDDIRRACKH